MFDFSLFDFGGGVEFCQKKAFGVNCGRVAAGVPSPIISVNFVRAASPVLISPCPASLATIIITVTVIIITVVIDITIIIVIVNERQAGLGTILFGGQPANQSTKHHHPNLYHLFFFKSKF